MFYSPISPLFTLFFIHLRGALRLRVLMPFTYFFCNRLCRKGTPSTCTIFPLCFVRELLRLVIYVVFVVVVLLLLAIPLELLVFLGCMCYYQFGRLRKCGVFVYHCKLTLMNVRGIRILSVTTGAKLVLHHVSFYRKTFCNPITAIFEDMKWDEYSYGDIEGVHLSAYEVEMYSLHQQRSVALQLQAESSA